MAENGSRFDARITLGNLITIAIILLGIGADIIRKDAKAEQNEVVLYRIENKVDLLADSQGSLRERVAVLEDRANRANGVER